MGSLESCVKKIADVRFMPFPASGVVRGIERVVCVKGYVYAIDKKGSVRTNSEMARKVHCCGTSANYHAVTALRLFGIITKEEAKQHGKRAAEQDALFAEYRAITCDIERLTSAGIKLTAKQKRILADMKKRCDVTRLPYFVQGEAARKLGEHIPNK